MPRLLRKTALRPALKPCKRKCLPASPMDTATALESQRPETTHVGASKGAFRTRLPYISRFAVSKSTFSYEFYYDPTSKSTFRVRFPSIFITCHKPRNLHLVTTPRCADIPILQKTRDKTRPKCCTCRKKMTSEVSKVRRLARKSNASSGTT